MHSREAFVKFVCQSSMWETDHRELVTIIIKTIIGDPESLEGLLQALVRLTTREVPLTPMELEGPSRLHLQVYMTTPQWIHRQQAVAPGLSALLRQQSLRQWLLPRASPVMLTHNQAA